MKSIPISKPNAEKIWVLGCSYSLDFLDFDGIDIEKDIIVGANAVGCIIPLDFLISIDRMSLPYYEQKAKYGYWVTHAKGRLLFQKPFDKVNYMIMEEHVAINPKRGGSGYNSVQWACGIAKQLKYKPEVHICGLDFLGVAFEKEGGKKIYQYANKLKSVLFDPSIAVPEILVGTPHKFHLTPSGSYRVQAESMRALFLEDGKFRQRVWSHGFSDFANGNIFMNPGREKRITIFHTGDEKPGIFEPMQSGQVTKKTRPATHTGIVRANAHYERIEKPWIKQHVFEAGK